MCECFGINDLFRAGKGKAQRSADFKRTGKLSSNGKPSMQRSGAEHGTVSAPPLKKIRLHQTAAYLCRYSTVDSEVAAGQAVLVGQVVDVIAGAEMAWL